MNVGRYLRGEDRHVGTARVERPTKGQYDGLCNRSACLKPGAQFFNHANRLYYCASCAHVLNSDPFTVRDAEGLWGEGMRFCEFQPTDEPLPERKWRS